MKRLVSLGGMLAFSLFIYLFYRSEKTVVNELLLRLCSFDTFHQLRSSIATHVPLHDIVVYSLPGGLWIFCSTALSRDFFTSLAGYRIPIVHIPVLFALGLEFTQLLHWIRGRFDPWDVVVYIAAWGLACWSYEGQDHKRDLLSPFSLHGVLCVGCILAVYLAHVNA